MSKNEENKTPRRLWLEEVQRAGTRVKYDHDFGEFLAWAKATDAGLVAEWRASPDKKAWAKAAGLRLMRYYTWLTTEATCYDIGYDEKRDPKGEHIHKGYSVNAARNRVSAVMAFLASQCDSVTIKRGAFPRPEMALGEHEFLQSELQAMFHYGDVQSKAILATAVSLGWGADDFLKLEWAVAGPLLGAEPFTGFWVRRGKTAAPARCHLTPEAVDSLRAWRKIAKSKRYVFANGEEKPWTDAALAYTLGEMVRKAGVAPRGKVRFHLLRKFLIRQLSNAGLNRDHIKIMVGKQVPSDLLTYLQDNVENLKAEFEAAHPRFSLSGHANASRTRIEELEATLKSQEFRMGVMQAVLDEVAKGLPEEERRRMLESVAEKFGLRKPRVWSLGELVEGGEGERK